MEIACKKLNGISGFGGAIMVQKVLKNVNSFFQGEVVKGNQIGRKLGFPTANLDLQSDVNFPMLNGVYSVIVHYNGQEFYGVMNIGIKPTFEDISRVKTFEVYILNFNQDIYGEILKVEICSFIRSERKFKSIEALKKQMHQDCKIAKNQLMQEETQQGFRDNYVPKFHQDIDLNVIHLPDLEFVKFCEGKFGINRGVYNTIDKWFAKNHTVNILWRRTTILRFLYWVTVYVPREEKLEFGAKGLSEQLSFYHSNHVVNQ